MWTKLTSGTGGGAMWTKLTSGRMKIMVFKGFTGALPMYDTSKQIDQFLKQIKVTLYNL